MLASMKRERRVTIANPEFRGVRGPEDYVFAGGYVTVILRPRDPQRKLDELDKIKPGTPHEVAKRMMDSLLWEQDHRFVGYASRDGKILDRRGRVLGDLQPGDSFAGGPHFRPPDFMLSGKYHTEQWGADTVFVLPRPDLKADSNTGIVMESDDLSRRGSIVTRGGITEPDCHIPSLNRIITGDPDIHWRTPQRANAENPQPSCDPS